ncbi:MAG: isoprenyl transferase [Sedimentisphaerales bacterium]|nr:isoprenyl transferase [Sedimentisphaerales bacterium]
MESSTFEKRKAAAKRLGIAIERMPRHIAIIMDGNGRWAARKGLPRMLGHRRGAETAENITQCCADFGIESLTLYSFSIDNWKRPKAEVNSLMDLYSEYLVRIRPKLMEVSVKLVHLGRLAQLRQGLKAELVETIRITAGNKGMVLALALNYGGRAEITDAVREIARKHKTGQLALADIDEHCISQHLYTAALAEPDLLIRTANEMRISNFLLWQISYSEFYVTRTFWPDFKKTNLERAILTYAGRKRRFGGI